MIDLRKIDKDRPYTKFSKEQLKEFLEDVFKDDLYKLDKVPDAPDSWDKDAWLEGLKRLKIELKPLEE